MISRYRVIRRLGAGGMGEVLLAQDTNLDRSVAIKIMSSALAQDPEQRKRFRQEAKAASGLVHPNICVIHEVGETEEGQLFLAMEFVEGQTLDRVMAQRRLRLREMIHVGIQVADALEAARARGIVHRDIKPANILLDDHGHVKVLDFGLAKRFTADTLGDFNESSVLHTGTGILIGTPHYMSPEQALGHTVDHRSDIFSLGVVLYELAAGQKPFLAKTVGETINLVVNQKPEPLGLENPIYTPAFDAIVFKCLEKKPEQRYTTAKELATDLRKLKEDSERAAALAKESAAVLTSQTPIPGTTYPAPIQRPVLSAQKLALAALVLFVFGLLGYFVVVKLRSTGVTPTANATREPAPPFAQQKSIAVLPFDNFSAEKDSDYLSDGLTEEITTALSRIPGLKVVSRNSAFTFKGHKEDLRKVGAALGVTTLLEGSLRKAGKQMRITAQLINAADGYHLWSETYDRSADDIFAVQDEIARKIAERLQVGTTSGSPTGVRLRPINMEAHEIYLQARHFWNQRGIENLEKAAQLFKQAIDKDPTYAAARAGLAMSYALLPDYAHRPSGEYFPLALASAGQALELDPSSADAHAVLGLIKSYSYDYRGAEAEFKRVLELNPNHATAHHWYGVLLRELGRMNESLTEMGQAEELDPLSPIIRVNVLTRFIYARQYDRGLEECERYLRAFPDFGLLHATQAWFFERKGRYKEAIDVLSKLRAGMRDDPNYLDSLALAYGRNGDEMQARKILAELKDWKRKGYAVRSGIASAHLGLREFDQAIASLDEALAVGENVQGLLSDPTLDELRSHPRFPALIKRAGLEPYWKRDATAPKQ